MFGAFLPVSKLAFANLQAGQLEKDCFSRSDSSAGYKAGGWALFWDVLSCWMRSML